MRVRRRDPGDRRKTILSPLARRFFMDETTEADHHSWEYFYLEYGGPIPVNGFAKEHLIEDHGPALLAAYDALHPGQLPSWASERLDMETDADND
jgi:hypothetical protein